MKNTIVCLIIIVILYALSGCVILGTPEFLYSGENTALDATAIYSIPGTKSDSTDQIIILETDDYGRVLYGICLNDIFIIENSFDNCCVAIVIMQKQDNDLVWFLPEQNYNLKIMEKSFILSTTTIKQIFTEDEISLLKEDNHWNKEMEEFENSYICAPNNVDRDYHSLNEVSKSIIENNIGSNYRPILFRTSSEGNSIYFILNILRHHDYTEYQWFFIMFGVDGNLLNGDSSIYLINNRNNINQELSDYLIKNNWDNNYSQ